MPAGKRKAGEANSAEAGGGRRGAESADGPYPGEGTVS